MTEAELLSLMRPRAIGWLAQREQSEAELRRKLARLARTLQQQAVALAAASNADHPSATGGPARRRRGVSPEPPSGRGDREAIDDGEALSRVPMDPSEGDADPAASVSVAVAPVVDQLIDWLRERHYLSDQRFVESRMRTRQGRFGLQRIQQELSQHGLSLGEAERQHLIDTELVRAHRVWVRKFGPELPQDAAARATQGRFLMQRGFSGEVIRQVLKGAGFAAEALPD